MFTMFLDIFFPHAHRSSNNPRRANWPHLSILFYALIGLFAFGHNYVNYPVKDTRWVRIVTINPDKGKDYYPGYEKVTDMYEEDTVATFQTGAKAAASGLFWPAYAMILLNEKMS